jgi:hypothetical protein
MYTTQMPHRMRPSSSFAITFPIGKVTINTVRIIMANATPIKSFCLIQSSFMRIEVFCLDIVSPSLTKEQQFVNKIPFAYWVGFWGWLYGLAYWVGFMG